MGAVPRSPDRSRQTKPRNRKTFYVRLLRRHDPEGVLTLLWEVWQPGRQDNWVLTHGDVHDGVVRLLIEYTVIGGHPADIRRKIGRVLAGVPMVEADCEVELRETVRV